MSGIGLGRAAKHLTFCRRWPCFRFKLREWVGASFFSTGPHITQVAHKLLPLATPLCVSWRLGSVLGSARILGRLFFARHLVSSLQKMHIIRHCAQNFNKGILVTLHIFITKHTNHSSVILRTKEDMLNLRPQ